MELNNAIPGYDDWEENFEKERRKKCDHSFKWKDDIGICRYCGETNRNYIN